MFVYVCAVCMKDKGTSWEGIQETREVCSSLVLGDFIIIIYYLLGEMGKFLVQQSTSSWYCLLTLPFS